MLETVDVMPDDDAGYGFTNPWYGEALKHPNTERLPNGTTIHILTVPYFLATKCHAHHHRGGDPYGSRDFEDIVTVLDGCTTIEAQLPRPGTSLGDYLRTQFDFLVAGDEEVIEACLAGSQKQSRVERIKRILSNVYGLRFP